ncbi:hypothetical protein [Methylobacter sp.]|uniref:hypothetical protein n=1 Tax=Methylobacter sp. TaxID=2051955 RepID=UPI0024893123|nr:hypothetical protein [Methylobacter sp.]MDI1277192.1 hypothetical protein [Methylobacter sp.]MDI1360044.1 hypothetical protein [Methylobacter sp.]
MLNERQLLNGQPVAAEALTSLRNWFPVTVQGREIVWRYVQDRFTASFFTDTLQQQNPAQRYLCRTGFDWLKRLEPGLMPSAFIFHTSRCGSTLLTQLLSTLSCCIVMSEPPVIDAFLRRHQTEPEASGGSANLRQLILALGQQRSPDETHFFIKLDSWHTQFLPIFRAAFPDTPCWFLYREPDAILASHRRQRGPQMVPGMIASLAAETLEGGDLDGYCAKVLAGFFEAALANVEHLQLINYRQLPDILWQDLLLRQGIDCTSVQLERMRQRAGFHAKDQRIHFSTDTPSISSHPILQQQVEPLYAQIEQHRSRGQ